MNFVYFCLGFSCVMLAGCYWKLCDVARNTAPKHN
jgi:hypothetical protein